MTSRRVIPSPTPIDVPADVVETWQQIVDLLAELCGVPAALVMRIADPHIEVLVASHGAGNPYHPGEQEVLEGSGLYCETVIKRQQPLLVPDALADPAWRENPDVPRGMISYLGFPILLPDRTPFGTLCVLDAKANRYGGTVEQLMQKLKRIIELDLERVYVNRALGDTNRRLSDYLAEIKALRGLVTICAHCKSIRDDHGEWIGVEQFLVRHPEAEFSHGLCPACVARHYPDDAQA